MGRVGRGRGTFVVEILDCQNGTIQGTVLWADGQRKKAFRSALELLEMIGAVVKDDEEKRHFYI